jgi:glycosyl transferase, family 25
MKGMRAWVINLDRSPQRLAGISQQLQTLGLPWQRVPAVDARALTPEEAAQLDEAAFRARHGMPPLAGELGCYLSHVKVMRAFLATDDAFAVVLEDDVRLHPSACRPCCRGWRSTPAAGTWPSSRPCTAARPCPTWRWRRATSWR